MQKYWVVTVQDNTGTRNEFAAAVDGLWNWLSNRRKTRPETVILFYQEITIEEAAAWSELLGGSH